MEIPEDEEDPADHPVDGGDNEDNESSDDENDDDDVVQDEEDEEEEEHLASADPSVETMTTVNQGMSVEEIERVVAQRVADAIEAIAIYETKTNMACKTPTAARNQQTRTCYECGSLRHYKSECPIVKFQNRADKKISTLVERQAENKRKLDNTSKNNQNQQQPNKRQNTGRAYTVGHGEKKHYGGSKPWCSKCNYHHDGPCALKCHQCNRVDHLACDCKSSINVHMTNNERGTGASQKANCYECGNQGHYRKDCPERKNQNHKNQIRGTGAHGMVHAFGEGETEQDLNNIKDEIEA
ncbi:hypothetical protein Tco_0242737 [Tanacetum coccineum]